MELKDYIRPLRKWWWLVVAATLVATAASFAATRQLPPVYSTRTTVMIGSAIENPNPNGTEFYLTQQLANTYADIVQRATVREGAMAALGLTWLPGYTARVVPNTQLIEISVTDTDPARAQAVAAAIVEQLILLSPTAPGGEDQQRQAFIAQQLDDLEVKISQTQSELTARQGELADMFSARQIADTQTQIAALQNKLATLQANYASLLSNSQRGALNSIQVIEAARLPTAPVGPNRAATVALAAAIGLILSAGAAALLEYLDDTLKNPEDVQKVLGITTLGAVPRLEASQADGGLAFMASNQTAATEAYRVLRTNLQFAAVDRPLRTLMITSPAPSEGKSLTTSNLAAALAQSGRRVVVVDADLHKPRLHRVFGLRNSIGITTGLLDEQPALDGLPQQTSVPGLRVVTSGPLPPNPAELLGSARMRDLLAQIAEQADIVLIDTPPVVALADAAILATHCDGVLLVVDAGATRREIARRAVEALRRVNARVVGAVLNRVPKQGGGYYYYYDHYDLAAGARAIRGNGRNGRRLAREKTQEPAASPAEETAQPPS